MSDHETFADGFREGYRAIMGSSASVPSPPGQSLPAGKTPYQAGIAKGVEAAMKRKQAANSN